MKAEREILQRPISNPRKGKSKVEGKSSQISHPNSNLTESNLPHMQGKRKVAGKEPPT
jgi:hypothetical protein